VGRLYDQDFERGGILAKGRERGSIDAGHRVKLYLDAHASEVAAFVSPISREILDALVLEGTTLQLQQLLSKGIAIGETAVWKQIQEDIFVAFLDPVASMEKRLNLNDPNLIVPGKVKRKGDYMAKLEVLANALPQYDKELLAQGLPSDFIARFTATIDALRTSTDSRDRARGNRSGATAGLAAVNTALRGHIDVMEGNLHPLLQKDGSFKAGWEVARRIHHDPIEPRRGGRPETPNADEPPSADEPPNPEENPT
jgi:hypothetical protein